MSSPTQWSLPFFQARDKAGASRRTRTALIILNQPFSKPLLQCLWHASDWHCCADGGANRLHDLLSGGTNADTNVAAVADRPTGWIASLVGWLAQPRRGMVDVDDYIPDLVKGDLDSVREEVRRYYETQVSWQ
jgi:thiamine pyrophosphokinase